MADISELPYAQFLEETIRALSELDTEKIAVVAFAGDMVYTGYYMCSRTDKHAMAGCISDDAVLEMVLANARDVVEAAEDDEEED